MNTHTDLARICAAEHLDYHGEQFAPAPLVPVQEQVCLPELLSLLARVTAFQNKAFPNQTLAGKLKHLVKEAGELRDCNGMEREEWADVLLLLLGAAALEGHTFADLVRFAHEKLTINESRTWLPADADGCYHHVKD